MRPTTAAPLDHALTDAPRILVVNEEVDNRQLLVDCLRVKGYRVQTVVDGVRALEAVRSGMFEGIILDIDIRSMDGLHVIQQIRTWNQQIPIVTVTESASRDLAARAIGMGVQAYMLKPFAIDELQRVADYWFRPFEHSSSESAGLSSRQQ